MISTVGVDYPITRDVDGELRVAPWSQPRLGTSDKARCGMVRCFPHHLLRESRLPHPHPARGRMLKLGVSD